MQIKKCRECRQTISIINFSRNKSRKDGYMYVCKACEQIRFLNRSRTEHGVIRRIYDSQKSTSKKRYHNPPEYTFKEFKDWCLSRLNWEQLYQNWVGSEYKTNLRPSVDRLKDNEGYHLKNIQLVTWRENLIKATDDQKSGRMIISHRKVIQLSKSGSFISEFFSIAEGGRITGLNASSIAKACKGKLKTTGGFKWKYKEDYMNT